MTQESVMIAFDSSDFMRNGDFTPSRLQAQQDAVNLFCRVKRQGNPENTVGLISLEKPKIFSTPTSEASKIENLLSAVTPTGSNICFCTCVRIACLALRHRQMRHQKMRIICFVGSPINDDEKDMIKLAKRLKKEKVNIDVVNFGEDEFNQKKLLEFVDTVNGKDGTGSHLVTVPPGSMLRESLITSPIIAGEDGSGALAGSNLGLEFGLDAAEDPDLLYALRVSMEDQRMRQEQEANIASGAPPVVAPTLPTVSGTSEEALLRQAIAMSMEVDPVGNDSANVDLNNMSEEDQIAYAIQMSMQADDAEKKNREPNSSNSNVMPMDVDIDDVEVTPQIKKIDKDETLISSESQGSSVANKNANYDPDFLQNVLENLPGVDPQNADVRKAIESLTGKTAQESPSKQPPQGDDKRTEQ